MVEIDIRICLKKKSNTEEYGKNTDTICLKKTNNNRELMKESGKNRPNNTLKKVKESNELRSVEVDVRANFIKDKVKSFSNAEVILMIMITLMMPLVIPIFHWFFMYVRFMGGGRWLRACPKRVSQRCDVLVRNEDFQANLI